MNTNVEYHYLRPAELVSIRQKNPVAYIGLGILEWHGLHNPVGLDAIKANEVAKRLARSLGGLVMPPLYWGDHRGQIAELLFDPAVSEWFPQQMADHASRICRWMGLSRKRLTLEGRRAQKNGGWRLWQELLVQMLFQTESLGFERIVLYPGHYPMIKPLGVAVDTFARQGGQCQVFVMTDQMAAEGDHAAKLETSLLLALRPDLVDLSQLQADESEHLGVLGEDPRTTASAEFGEQILAKFEQIVAEFVEGKGPDASHPADHTNKKAES